MSAAVEAVRYPSETERAEDAEQERVADAAVEGKVVELAEEIFAQHVHVGNGSGHRAPDHGPVADAASQHCLPTAAPNTICDSESMPRRSTRMAHQTGDGEPMVNSSDRTRTVR